MYDLVSRCFIVLRWEVAYLLKLCVGKRKHLQEEVHFGDFHM